MKTSVLLVALAATVAVTVATSAVPAGRNGAVDVQLWTDYVKQYGKTYADATAAKAAFKNFQATLDRIEKGNAVEGSTVFGLNKFSDMSAEEFKRTHLTYKAPAVKPVLPVFEYDATVSVPDSMDWTKKGAITPVKNQGQCGSCWAFSATETIESYWFLAGHDLTKLSVQQIVSCDNNDLGCNGGDTITAYQYVEKFGGLEASSSYPYKSGSGYSGQCKEDHSKIVAHISGYKYATQDQDEKAMEQATATVGPLSICVDAETWQDYNGGILRNNCGQQLDHCVQITGYDQSDDTKYWVVRNSWGTDWGINGYIYVERNKDLCGIADEATYVTI